MIDDKQVRHTAQLARLGLSDQEVKKYAGQLGGILEYMDILKEVNTDNVPMTSQVTGLENVDDEDKVLPAQSTKAELLDCSELPVDSGQIRVKDVL